MLRFFIIAAAIAAIAFLYVRYLENTSIFFPAEEISSYPDDFGLQYEEAVLTAPGGVEIHGWFLPYPGSREVLLFLHGNGGNISHRLDKIALLRREKLNIFIIDYRGYGKSSGKPTEAGIYQDAKAAYDYLLCQRAISPGSIILYGESLGAAVAVELAASNKVAALIIEGGFSNGKDMGSVMFPYLPAFMIPDKFNSLEKIKRIDEPKLFIHSQDDEIVPIEFAEKLYGAAPEPKYFYRTVGPHNATFLNSEESYLSAVKDFLKALNR